MSTTHPAPAVADHSPITVCPTGPAPAEALREQPHDVAARAFSLSMLISGIRCVLTYVIFPWVLPAVGHAGGIGPGLGLAVGAVAITSNVFSIRRFMRTGHRWRWLVATVNLSVIALLGYLVVIDVAALLG